MQEIAHERQQRTYIRLTLGILIGLVALCFLGWWGARSYNSIREERAVKKAAAYIAEGNLKMAAISARRALQVNQNSAAAARTLADIAEKTGDKAAIDWRRRVLDLASGSPDDVLKYAEAAITFEETALAQKILEGVSESDRQRADYHAAFARLAGLRKDQAAARQRWEEAVRLDPANGAYQREFAVSRLVSPDAAEREAGLNVLRQLRNDPQEALRATRFLVRFGLLSAAEPAETKKLARELQTLTGAEFNDHLLLLDVIRRFADPAFPTELENAQQKARSEPPKLAMLLEWMNAAGLNLGARDFVSSLPPETVGKWPVPWQLGKVHLSLTDWPALEQLATTTDWGRMNYLRYAYLARAQRALEKPGPEERAWTAAVQEAERDAEALKLLTRTAMEWGWNDRAEEVAWKLAEIPSARDGTLRELYQHYYRTGNTQGLYRALNRLVELHPTDLVLRNNLAQVSFLLKVEVDRARRLAQTTLEEKPDDAAFVTTAAFGDYIRGDYDQALSRMRGLSSEELEKPEISTYYGLFLSAAGEVEQAANFLKRSEESRLLPEEQALIDAARKRLRASSL